MSLVHTLAQQARRPNGFLGRLFGFSMSRINRGANAWIISQLNVASSDRVLEIGYGPGQAIELLTSTITNGKIAGIDFSETMLRSATARNKNAIQQGLVELKVGDATALPYADGSFDKVFFVNVIYFWENPVVQLKEIHRVLAVGGKVGIYMGDAEEMKGVKITQTGVFNLYSAQQAMDLLTQAGFTSCEYAATAISQGPLSKGVCVIGKK